MFVGTIDRLDVSRTVLIETHYFSRLDKNIYLKIALVLSFLNRET